VRNYLPFAKPEIGEEEIAEVIATLRSGWLTTGPKAKKFEADFCDFVGAKHAMAVNSATAGLHLALEAIGVGAGDEVITTTYTFTATAEVVRYLGADPVFVDVEPATLNLDPAKIESAITERTKAIIVVHFAGLACDMDTVLDVAKRNNLKVIEDAAHALPASFDGAMIGSLKSDVTVFSFYATKTITTGEGGMVVTDDPVIASRIKTMRLHGISTDVFGRYNAEGASWYYEVVAPGFKYNMSDIAASIGIHQLRKAQDFASRRADIALRYLEGFHGLPLILPARNRNGDLHAWHLFVVRVTDSACITRDEFVLKLNEKGIGTSVHFIPLHMQPYWQDMYDLEPQDFPAARHAYEAAISLPIYSSMTVDDCDRVVNAVQEILS
jgi:dTDP-4-amino-4,6-dideoxygalactose transaminase